jgi:[ribosomal protein S5]-alanine N-acetyltransferase
MLTMEERVEFPELRTARLKLTRIGLQDAPAVLEMFSHPDVVRYYDLELISQIAQAQALIELFESRHRAQAGIRWAIRMSSTAELLGTCGYNSWSAKMRNATIGYDLKRAHWGKGIATEAVREAIRAAFAGRLACGPLHRIQADTIPGNLASESLLLKLGFKEEGTRRECAYLRGEYHDMKCFGLVRPDFR